MTDDEVHMMMSMPVDKNKTFTEEVSFKPVKTWRGKDKVRLPHLSIAIAQCLKARRATNTQLYSRETSLLLFNKLGTPLGLGNSA